MSLELGGKSAAIVCDDADLDAAVPRLVGGGMHLSARCAAPTPGSSCPGKRYAEAVDAAARRRRPLRRPVRPQDGRGAARGRAPARPGRGFIASALADGARAAAGGAARHLPKGWYVPPTILADVDNGMRVARDEIFEPVLSFIPFDGEDDAVRIANDSRYGLSGGVWSADAAAASPSPGGCAPAPSP